MIDPTLTDLVDDALTALAPGDRLATLHAHPQVAALYAALPRYEAALRDERLVESAVRVAIGRTRRRSPAWVRVGDALAVGSTSAVGLCRRFGYDPDTGKREEPTA